METAGYGNNELLKNVAMEGLILFAAFYQMDAMLNLPIMHEKEKNENIILLLVKQNPLIY